MRRFAKDDMLDYIRADEPQLLNSNIVDNTTTMVKKILTVDHRVTWYNYYLNQTVDIYSVATIVANTDHQYLTENHKDYVGYANETTCSMIA